MCTIFEKGKTLYEKQATLLCLTFSAPMQINLEVTLLEPILIICMAVVVGFIMIAVMLPIYQSYAAIENA